ncbi:MAG: deoxyribose-phosphate aldolase [Gaiellaceae bacterium]
MASGRYSVESLTVERLAKAIDHSLLRPELDLETVSAGCELARRYAVASACVKPCDVRLAHDLLAGSAVKVSTVIGFPHGSSTAAAKRFEAEQALAEGAEELDMVLNIGRLRSGAAAEVQSEIAAVVAAAAGRGIVKVILENAYLDEAQKLLGCRLAEQAGARFVKTSTGFAPGGATLEDLRLMRSAVSAGVEVKAAGGIRTLDAALAALEAGATRIGATATEAILEELRARRQRLEPAPAGS